MYYIDYYHVNILLFIEPSSIRLTQILYENHTIPVLLEIYTWNIKLTKFLHYFKINYEVLH